MGRRQPKTRREREQQQRAERQTLPPPCEHLPKTIQQIWQQVWNDDRCKNLSLIVDRYAPWMKVGNEWNLRMHYRRRQKEDKAEGQSAKGLWLRNERDETMIHEPIYPNKRVDNEVLNAVKQRHEAIMCWYEQQGFKVRQFEAKPVWRFVVGLGAAHVLETAITLHRIFGLPIIPASGLKGAARAYALGELATRLGVPILSPSEPEELEAKKGKTPLQKLEELIAFFATETDKQKRRAKLDEFLKIALLPPNAPIRGLDPETLWQTVHPFVEVFGTTEQAGKIVFLDAVPLNVPKFELDIMNPHFPDYYRTSGQASPSDWQSPTPITFLTVSKTSYCFAIAARTKDVVALLDTAERWLKGALGELGIGAKTSANYGYWEVQ